MYIATLDTIHHQGLRLALGTFRTSPVKSLYVEANEPWLNLRRKKLAMQYFLKLRSNPLILTHRLVFNPLYKELFLKKERIVPPFGICYGPEVAKQSQTLLRNTKHKDKQYLWKCGTGSVKVMDVQKHD